MPAPAMTADEIAALLRAEFPQVFHPGCGLSIEHVDYGEVRVRRSFRDNHLRPGGTISGPAMMELADFAMYVAVFSVIGPQPRAVTATLTINFLRRPAAGDLVAEAKVMKTGKRLIAGQVTLFPPGADEPVAHVTSIYSVPNDNAQI